MFEFKIVLMNSFDIIFRKISVFMILQYSLPTLYAGTGRNYHMRFKIKACTQVSGGIKVNLPYTVDLNMNLMGLWITL